MFSSRALIKPGGQVIFASVGLLAFSFDLRATVTFVL